MYEEIISAGFGGQGVLFVGQLLAYTALAEGKHVTWIPSYGPEMRGGTANCTVVIADEPIGSPVSQFPNIALVFNNPSFERYEPVVRPGGLLVVNQSLVMHDSTRTDIDVALVPATELATELGETRVANLILLGALLARRPIVAPATVEQVLIDKLGDQKAHLREINLRAFARGLALGQVEQA
ncbi:MAG: 2-oxoacid:ferredoxin oxidoreductase subunit gamma [Rhodococcus sp.]|nr:2-oxoacid:ferredoxin oxidoreductase subunit gamma [Rhodococcus sp. (in: high G+C Gram-positive bacteria)]